MNHSANKFLSTNLALSAFFGTVILGGALPAEAGICCRGLQRDVYTSGIQSSTFERGAYLSDSGLANGATDPKSYLIKQIQAMFSLEDDWDSYESPKPEKSVLDFLIKVIPKIDLGNSLPKTKVGGEGDAGLYWKTAKGYLDITAYPSGQIVIYQADPLLEPVSFYEIRSFEEAVSLLQNKINMIA